jgi:uncharacterized membrane protein
MRYGKTGGAPSFLEIAVLVSQKVLDDGGACKEKAVHAVGLVVRYPFPIPFGVVHWWVTLIFFAIFAVLMWAMLKAQGAAA